MTPSHSPLIYGCMNLGGIWNDPTLTRDRIDLTISCVRQAIESGITTFDHADIYARGKSERAFAHVWDALGVKRESVFLQSKCGIRFAGDTGPDAPHRFDFSHEHIVASVAGSLERLRTEYLDLLLLHRPDVLAEPEEIARAFDDLRRQKLVRSFGVSNFNAAQTELLRSALAEPIAANQVEFNLLHSDLLDESTTFNNRHQRNAYRSDGTLEYCRLNRIGLQAYSPLAKGRLTPASHDADERTKSAAAAVHRVASSLNVSGESVMIAWILRHPARIRPVIGTTSPDRIRDQASAVKVVLSREQWYALFLAGRGADLP